MNSVGACLLGAAQEPARLSYMAVALMLHPDSTSTQYTAEAVDGIAIVQSSTTALAT